MTDTAPAETEHAHLEGFISVTAALEGGRRTLHSILLKEGREDGQTRHLAQLAREARGSG